MIRESGENWELWWSGRVAPTIYVIEPVNQSYDDYHERKKKEEAGARKVPFGFSRALDEPPSD